MASREAVRRLTELGEPDCTWAAYRAVREHAHRCREDGRSDLARVWTTAALPLIRLVIEQSGETTHSLNALASVLRDVGRPELARQYNARSLEMDPSPVSNRAAWTTRGALLREGGQLAAAFETLESVFHRHPRDAYILRALIAVCAVLARQHGDEAYAELALHYVERLAALPEVLSDALTELREMARRAKRAEEREALAALVELLDVPEGAQAPCVAEVVGAADGLPF